MSAAAVETASTTISQLKLKGSVRALLEAIATLIPEGETMTAPIAIEDVATLAGYQNSTTREARDKLVELRLLKLHGGGQGRLAQYELLTLPGAGREEPKLPLIGPVKSARTPPSGAVATSADLFADASDAGVVEVRADHIADFRRSWRSYFADFRRCCAAYFADFRRSTRMVDAVDDARAYAVRTASQEKERTHTHTAPPAPTDPPPAPPRCRGHAWCDGRVHVPQFLHDEFRRRLQLTEPQLVATYVEVCATLAPDAVIGEDDVTFWRRRMARRFPTRADRAPPVPRPTTRDVWECPHTPHCLHRTPCQRLLELAAAKASAARDRQTG